MFSTAIKVVKVFLDRVMHRPLYPNYGTSENSVPGSRRRTFQTSCRFSAEFSRRFIFSRCKRFRVSHVLRKCWDIPSVFHFSLLFPKDAKPFFRGFWGLDKFGKAGMPFFSKNTRCFGADLLPIGISDARYIRAARLAMYACGILSHSWKERRETAATPLRGKGFDFGSFRGFARSLRRQWFTVFRRIFLGIKFRKFHIF